MDLHSLTDWEALIQYGTENQNYSTNLRDITFHSRIQEKMIVLTRDRCYKFKCGAGIINSTSSTSPSNHPSVTSTATTSTCVIIQGNFQIKHLFVSMRKLMRLRIN